MRIVLTDPQPALCAWLCEKLRYVPTRNMITFATYNTVTKEIMGAVGFDHWSPTCVEMQAAGSGNWLTRELLFKSFAYPFIQGKCTAVVAQQGSNNAASIKFSRRLGFVEQCRIPGAWEHGADMVIIAMQKHECRWLDIAAAQKKAA